jgi:hypothetical protein
MASKKTAMKKRYKKVAFTEFKENILQKYMSGYIF